MEVLERVRWSEEEVLNCSAVRLARMIRSREVTSERVVQTCISRIQQVDPVINAVVADNFHHAVRRAREVCC